MQLKKLKPTATIHLTHLRNGQQILISSGQEKKYKYPRSEYMKKKMLSIPSYQRTANQNHNEILPCSCQITFIQKAESKRFWQHCGESGGSYTL